jgi:hypothetical protein
MSDQKRDLAADLAEYGRLANDAPEWVGGTMREADLTLFARLAYREAAERAIEAEAEVQRLRILLRWQAADLSEEQAAKLLGLGDDPVAAREMLQEELKR